MEEAGAEDRVHGRAENALGGASSDARQEQPLGDASGRVLRSSGQPSPGGAKSAMDGAMEGAGGEEMGRVAGDGLAPPTRPSWATDLMDGLDEEGSEACVSGAITPIEEEEAVAGTSMARPLAGPWKFVTFSSSKWVRLAGGVLQLIGKKGDEQLTRDEAWFDKERRSKAQFAERFTVVRGKLKFNRRNGELVKITDPEYESSLPCDDAESQSDNFVSIFDGVGACRVW